ncbi:ketopantoate reductase family protein [Actinokineospora inagensis]|uniref:ketopantoate reductase family protein n=1 Tax=Actinokineospora inagensis TaxID=103730 RepID=UPI0003FF8831|nr:2-dehydropantoate 2-reductase N-terminal domain-containing protein [Actinokineospora inagensis]
MRYVVVGAGAVGSSIGGRLYAGGHEVVLVARGAHGAALRAGGLTLVTPRERLRLPVAVAERPDEVDLRVDDALILAVKSQDTIAALDVWAARPVGGVTAGERLPVVCAQNGVANERMALRRFRNVYGMCVILPSTHLRPGEVIAPGDPYTGQLTLGRYPTGTDSVVEQIAADMEKSGLLAPVVADVMRWKYAKLLNNLANAIDAVTGTDAPDLRARARAEAWAVFTAAGISCVTDEEFVTARGGNVRVAPIDGVDHKYSSSWQSLTRHTGTIEADYLNGEITLLGRLHGVPTPVNDALTRAANESARLGRAPGTLTVDDLTRLVAAHP